MHAGSLQQASLNAESRRESVMYSTSRARHGNAGDTNIEINGLTDEVNFSLF